MLARDAGNFVDQDCTLGVGAYHWAKDAVNHKKPASTSHRGYGQSQTED
jgi:hypothetical protein